MWVWYLGCIVAILVCFWCGEFFGSVWKEISDYEEMKAKGYKLLKNDKGEYYWVGYDRD